MNEEGCIRANLISKPTELRLLATTGYCVKCKAKREMKGERAVTMKNGRNAITGTCSVCGTKMFKIGGGGGGKAKAKKGGKKKKSKGKKRR
jgi:RNase P subunit RPR2